MDMKLDWPHLTLLAAYGLAYCYIASSPFLVFHAGRFLLESGDDVKSLKRSLLRWSVALILAVPAAFILVWAALFLYRRNGFVVLGEFLSWWAPCFSAPLVWLLQWPVVWRTIKDARLTNKDPEKANSKVYRFYRDLAKRRGTDEAERGGIVDSYRHLREHGNALSIVVLEIVLGAALIRVASVASDDTKLPLLALVLAVWVLPGALVWFVGTLIELRFSEDAEWLEERTTPGAPGR
jgi:hypothetical protein